MADLPSIVFLGAGQIAEAIIGGVLDSRLSAPSRSPPRTFGLTDSTSSLVPSGSVPAGAISRPPPTARS